MYKKIIVIFLVITFSFTLFAQEKKKETKKPKVKTGVELEKGDTAPQWDKKILKKKKTAKESDNESEEKVKKEQKEAKRKAKEEMKKMKRERKLEKKKNKLHKHRGKK